MSATGRIKRAESLALTRDISKRKRVNSPPPRAPHVMRVPLAVVQTIKVPFFSERSSVVCCQRARGDNKV